MADKTLKDAATATEQTAPVSAAQTNSSEVFQQKIVEFKKVNALSMTLARELSEMAFDHFEQHGNLDRAQQFYDALVKDWNRRTAFVAWLCDHSPAKFENKLFKKDRRPEARDFNASGAKAHPFWEYLPEAEVKVYNSVDVVNDLLKVIKNHRNEKKFKALDEATKNFLNMAEAHITKLGMGNTATGAN